MHKMETLVQVHFPKTELYSNTSFPSNRPSIKIGLRKYKYPLGNPEPPTSNRLCTQLIIMKNNNINNNDIALSSSFTRQRDPIADMESGPVTSDYLFYSSGFATQGDIQRAGAVRAPNRRTYNSHEDSAIVSRAGAVRYIRKAYEKRHTPYSQTFSPTRTYHHQDTNPSSVSPQRPSIIPVAYPESYF